MTLPLGPPSTRLALVLAAALGGACGRTTQAPQQPGVPPETRPPAAPSARPPRLDPEPTAAQQAGRTPGERGSEGTSGRSDRHRRAAARASTVRTIEGTLERLSGEGVVIRAPGEERVALRLGGGTAITIDGRPAAIEALREGAEVRASYASGRAGRPTALSIEARSSAAGGAGGPLEPAPTDATWAPNTGELGSAGGG